MRVAAAERLQDGDRMVNKENEEFDFCSYCVYCLLYLRL